MTQHVDRIPVLHYASSWLPTTEIWLYDQIVHLPEFVDSHIVCEAVTNWEQFAIPNLHCFTEQPLILRYWDRGLRKLRVRSYLGSLLRRSREIDPLIVHSHFGNVGWSNSKGVQRLGARHVVTFYGLDVNHLPTLDPRWIDRYLDLFVNVDRVLCEGPHMAKCLMALGCAENKINVHHLGVRVDDIPYVPRTWQPGEPLRVLIAASFREKKGIPYALAALGAIQDDVSLRVTVIGDATGEARSEAEKAKIMGVLRKHNLEASTRFLGFCAYNELLKEAYDHHIFLSPSITASDGDTEGGAPVGIIQMAASGMPIVSTKHCDIPNVLPASLELAEERDVNGLVKQLRWFIENAGDWGTRLAEARQHIRLNFNAHIQGQRLADIYAEVVGLPRNLRRGVPSQPGDN